MLVSVQAILDNSLDTTLQTEVFTYELDVLNNFVRKEKNNDFTIKHTS